MTTYRTRLTVLVAAGAVLLAGCSSSSGPSKAAKASASKSSAVVYDAVFLKSVDSVWHGIDPALKIRVARSICVNLDDGSTFTDQVAVATGSGLTAGESGTLIGAAVAVYCPSHADMPTTP